jgi:hypothetical protein
MATALHSQYGDEESFGRFLAADASLVRDALLTPREAADVVAFADEGVALDPLVPAYAKLKRIAGDS